MPRALFVPKPAIHLTPTRSSLPSSPPPRACAGMAWTNEPSGRGWIEILGGSSAPWASSVIVRSASARRCGSSGIDSVTSSAER